MGTCLCSPSLQISPVNRPAGNSGWGCVVTLAWAGAELRPPVSPVTLGVFCPDVSPSLKGRSGLGPKCSSETR